MAIRQCKDVFHTVKIMGRSYDERSWEVGCDTCASVSVKKGDDPGAAHEKAWKEGFRPRSVGVLRPMNWHCPACSVRLAGNGTKAVSGLRP